jgi:hypothetical protein
MRNSTRERRRFTGTGGGQNTEILSRRLTNNAGLFVIECHGTFREDKTVTH